MDKFLYPTHPICCIFTGSSCCAKSVFPKELILNFLTNLKEYKSTQKHIHSKIYIKNKSIVLVALYLFT